MSWRTLALLLAAASLFGAAKKTVAEAAGENQDLALTVTLYIDPVGVKDLLGSELEHFIVAAVKVAPKSGKEILIDRDDFQLRTDLDGERTKPLAPSQIAGPGALIITQTQGSSPRTSGGVGPVGFPGGSARRSPGVSGGGGDAGATTTVRKEAPGKDNSLEQTLKSKELPQVKTGQPASGLLYFAMEKQKMKDLELTYGGRQNRITLRFK